MSAQQSIYKNYAQKAYDITDEKRAVYRQIAHESRLAKLAAEEGLLDKVHAVNVPLFNPNDLMPQLPQNPFTALSLFSGGGGLDLGFDRAGFEHVASYELIPICQETFLLNRPTWQLFTGADEGDVTNVDWQIYSGQVDVIHGGPPCQPFSVAGEQKGQADERNMWGEFNRAVNTIKPRAFVAENVLGLLHPKFEGFVKQHILDQLSDYHIRRFEMHTADFGVPQIRRRVFFVGFREETAFKKFFLPEPTHRWRDSFNVDNSAYTLTLFNHSLPQTMGVRAALGLPPIAHPYRETHQPLTGLRYHLSEGQKVES